MFMGGVGLIISMANRAWGERSTYYTIEDTQGHG